MAEAFLKVALEKLTSLIGDNIGSIIGVDDEMRKLESIFTTIQAVLEDAELNHLENRAIQNWLLKLNDITYGIDDILDECATHVARSKQLHLRGGLHGLKKILFRHKIAKRIKQALQKLDEIVAERDKFHLRESDFRRSSDVAVPVLAREMGSLLNEPQHIFGRKDEKEEIVDILVNKVKDEGGISVLPIVGIGGLGKTTLAQLVFNDPRVGEHFGTKIWVCVSDNFEVGTLIKAIIEFVTGKGDASDLVHLPALQHRLLDLLKQKRYLLVLDDVWSDDQDKWSQLRNALSCGLAGSSIIVTTRLQKVAEIMETLPGYKLKGLQDEHCWMLFKHRAFGCGEGERYPNLEALGMQIVKKCKGVPLVAKVLGGLLRFKRSEREWINVKDSNIKDQGEAILPVLKLSYHHLPLELRQCFAYCAIFPKDFRISKDELLNLWMAHGYISSNGALEVEHVGEQILNELIVRSLLQIADYAGFDGAVKITMHDLVHDLAQSIMENKASGTRHGSMSTKASTGKIREVNLKRNSMAFPTTTLNEVDIPVILMNYKCLRVLDGSHSRIQDLPSNFDSLKHLRLLNLSWSKIRILPNSLCNIWNLQVLILNFCYNLVGFPKKMRSLKNLRHFHFEGCFSLQETPSAIRELTLLKTLSEFIVGQNKGNRLEELEFLNLGGKLTIRHLERVENPDDAKKANLIHKQNLHDLSFGWEGNDMANLREDRDEKVLEALQPHSNVESLKIIGFRGRHFPNWMKTSTLQKLVRIYIRDCRNLLDFLYLEELPCLEELQLDNVNIEYLGQGGNEVNTCFPALKEMELCALHNLKGFFKEEVIQEICPNLRKLCVRRCPFLVLPPLNCCLDELDCDNSSILTSFPKLHVLRKLTVWIGKNLTCIPCDLAHHIPNLNKLEIIGGHEDCVPVNALQGFNSLQSLTIGGNDMTCLPKDWLHHNSNVEEITIYACSKFEDISEEIKHLQSLKRITLHMLPKMVCIPNAIKLVNSLELLFLHDLKELTALPDWLADLQSLCSLYILKCPKLASLPDSIKEMTNLQSLTVNKCPNIKRRCEKGKGEDWHKIAHIPYLDFDD